MSRAQEWLAIFVVGLIAAIAAASYAIWAPHVEAQEPDHFCNGKAATIYVVSHTSDPRSEPVEVLGTDGDDVIVVPPPPYEPAP